MKDKHKKSLKKTQQPEQFIFPLNPKDIKELEIDLAIVPKELMGHLSSNPQKEKKLKKDLSNNNIPPTVKSPSRSMYKDLVHSYEGKYIPSFEEQVLLKEKERIKELYKKEDLRRVKENESKISDDELEEEKLHSNSKKKKIISHVFEIASLDEVVDAIATGRLVENISILEKVKSSDFLFTTKDQPELSLKVSKALAKVRKEDRTLDPEISEMGRLKSKENAYEFARQMYEIVQKIKAEEQITTYRETVAALNKHQIPTGRGGDWHLKTLQNLNKRWKELGFISESKPK